MPTGPAGPRRDRKARDLRGTLPQTARTGVVFLDETGTISQGRFFGVACLKLTEPSVLLREVQALRDRRNFHIAHGNEFHFADVTRGTISHYMEAIDLVVAAGAAFSCFIADRTLADPVARFGSSWRAYEKLAIQLLLGTISRREIVTVLADNYSTPKHVKFEVDVRDEVNQRLGKRLAVSSVFRLDSKSTDGLQLVDILLGAVTFRYRLAAGECTPGSIKDQLSRHVLTAYGISDFEPENSCPPTMNVRLFGAT
ncbi:MAG: DUF3800 domain-containing protein [Actinomycetota bacterium]|nr:DUF3800 domain-containing protein [Actinomycetota bacterium]